MTERAAGVMADNEGERADRPADGRSGWIGRVTGSVRFRVTALATVAVLGVLTVAAHGVVRAQERLLTESIDESLMQAVDRLTDSVRAGDMQAAVFSGLGDDDAAAQIVDDDGHVIDATPNVAGRDPIADLPVGRSSALRTSDDLPHDDARFRIASRRVDGSEGPVTVHVAASLDDVLESTTVLGRSLAVGIPVVVLLLALVVWMLVGRTLRSVERIRAEVAEISGSDLHRRVPAPPRDDEIARLARTMNSMLDRVEDAADRQQRFVADASHELRSPLTRMRAELEVDLAHPSRADPIATHRSVLEEATGLQRLVEDLLQLARTDSSRMSLPDEVVDLDDLVLAQASVVRESSGVRVDSTGVSAAQVRGDAGQLARAVANLSDNATRHAASSVTLTVGERDDRAVVTVGDDGPGIPADERERVFERFARLDEARQRDAGGAGLGLAIAREIARRHGGTLTVADSERPGAVFVLTLPLHRPEV
jgi:signal transduction histidine kinase